MEERIARTRAERNLRSAELRRRFRVALYRERRIVWPLLSGSTGVQLGLGALVAHFEQWPGGSFSVGRMLVAVVNSF